MQLHKSPMFRKEPVPWYRCVLVCIIALMVLAAVIVLALIGIKVAFSRTSYKDYVWVPLLLAGASVYLFGLVCLRLIRRRGPEGSA